MLECRRRRLRAPVLMERGKNIKYGENVGDNKVYVSESKLSPGTNPELLIFSTARSYIPALSLPSSTAKDPGLGILNRWVDLPIPGEKPFWAESLWVWVDVFVVTYSPARRVRRHPALVRRMDQSDIFYHRRSCGNEHPLVNIIFHQPMRRTKGDRRGPSQCFLDDRGDVGKSIHIRGNLSLPSTSPNCFYAFFIVCVLRAIARKNEFSTWFV